MLFTIVVVVVTTILSSTAFRAAARVDTSSSITGKPFKNITHCANSHHISPSNIHVLMMGSEKFLESYQLQLRSFQEYCKLHGYHFHTQDPAVVYKKVGIIRSDGGNFHIVSSKPLFIHYYMRELFHKYGCEAKWLLYADADSVMVDLTRSLESIISFANQQYYPPTSGTSSTKPVTGGSVGGEGCEVIAQLSSSTINAGIAFFRISPAGDKLVRNWISTYIKHQAKGMKWQDDQGWFQYTYLQHLQRLYDIQWPLDCGTMTSRVSRMPEASLRSQCFASLLYLTGLMPLPHRPHILYQPHRVVDIVNGKNSSSSSDSDSDGNFLSKNKNGHSHKGVRFCVMAGLTAEDRFNTHDWATELLKSPSSPPQRSSRTKDGELKQTMIRYVQSGKKELVRRSSCPLDHLLLFHGRDEAIVAFLKRTFDSNLEKAKQLMNLAAESKLVFQYANGSEAHTLSRLQKVTSFHLFQCNATGVCIVPPQGAISSHMTALGNYSCESEVAAALGTSGSSLRWIADANLPKEVGALAKQLERNRLEILG